MFCGACWLVFSLVFSSLLLVFYITSILELIDNMIENKVPFFYVLKYDYYITPEIHHHYPARFHSDRGIADLFPDEQEQRSDRGSGQRHQPFASGPAGRVSGLFLSLGILFYSGKHPARSQ